MAYTDQSKEGEAPICRLCGCPEMAHSVNGKLYTNHAAYVAGTTHPAFMDWAQYKAAIREAYGTLKGVRFHIA